MRLSAILVTLSGALGLLAGCASIIHGSTQEVEVSSEPSKAEVFINGNLRGTTPLSLSLKRKKRHVITVSLPGYRNREIALERRVDGWVWGNIILGGLIGLVIDASTGAMYRIEPDRLRAQLQPISVEARKDGLSLHIRIGTDVPPGADKVGQLHPVGGARLAVNR
ncbi:hypothetical protein PC39_11812 [Salinisphaera sp. PC39]|uniref:PEGA domain-containing protein n=1 Tax=Salinisphaera sp. PC39 TaxID=1304156 RepID=UPI0033414251